MGLRLIRAFRPVRDRQAEETGEPQRLDALILAFQRPADNFGADIDAEGRLQRGAPRPG